MKLSLYQYLSGLFLSALAFNVSAQSFEKIEAVEYDAKRNRFLVSNGSSIIERKANGDLGIFGDGATANYGMEVYDDKLFAINSKKIMGYELETGKEVMSLNVSGAGFLNGMASTGDGILYVTDFSNKKIFKIDVTDLQNPTATVYIDNTSTTPNGIVFDEKHNRLVFVSWGSNAPIKAIDLASKEITTVKETSLGQCDGIDTDSRGNFYVSSWAPQQISKFDNNFTKALEKIDASGLNNPADICYAKEIDSLAIPNVSNSTVTFVGFDSTVDVAETLESKEISMFPNPIKAGTELFLEGVESFGTYQLLDVEGKVLVSKQLNNIGAGQQSIALKNMEPGIYFLRLSSAKQTLKKKLMVVE